MAGKRISISMLKDEVKVFDEYVEFPVSVPNYEDDFIVKVYPVFKPEKIKELTDELFGFIAKCKEEKVPVSRDEEDDLVGFFIVKHFTDIKFTKSKKAAKMYEEFKIAINTELFKQLIEQFPQESINTLNEYIYSRIEAGEQIALATEKLQQSVKNLSIQKKKTSKQK